MSGPPKTPTHLRLVRGNPSKRPINQNEPQPSKWVPPTPKHFTKQGKYWFKRLGDQLVGIGVLTELDGKALEMLVDAYVDYRLIKETLEREGATKEITTTTGDVRVKPSDFFGESREARKEIRGWLQEFGMTPSSRSKVNASTPEQLDPLAEILNARD
ncbi:MAG: phage terminase small subunit P27 family [Candidatus Symbiopectobacterium sp. Dall1.0]|nr:phage terminase small subunit P27 family [Candidatus Symbiopectobacterium sp. Dall1.0]